MTRSPHEELLAILGIDPESRDPSVRRLANAFVLLGVPERTPDADVPVLARTRCLERTQRLQRACLNNVALRGAVGDLQDRLARAKLSLGARGVARHRDELY